MVNEWITVCLGELKKLKANYFSSTANYISLLIWPVLIYFSNYYTYSSFDISVMNKYGIESRPSLMTFLITGALGYNCFWAMVQSAFFMTNERENGTLEIVFLTPANRLAIVYGRALGGIIQNIWMFSLFSVLIVIVNNGISISTLIYIPLGFFVLLIAATIWGGLINSIFIVSRDTNFWFTICDEPMYLFSGAKVPVEAFPFWGKVISAFFPLTYCLYFIRKLFSYNITNINYLKIFELFMSMIVLFILTKLILYMAEKNNRRTGNLQLY